MDPIRSSLLGGVVAATLVGTVLLVFDAVAGGTSPFALTTFSSACLLGGEPFCAATTATATLINVVVYLALFAIAWPLLFAGFTWGLPGDSGVVHGAVFGAVLWSGYAAVAIGTAARGWTPLSGQLPLLSGMAVAYLLYGVVLGGIYDNLAAHRTLLSGEGETAL